VVARGDRCNLATTVMMLAAMTAVAGTVDEKIKKGEADGTIEITTKGNTHDACDKGCDVTFTSTTDGDVVVKPGETKYFEINKTDDFTRDGGFQWKCCGSSERSRIKGATYIKVVRKEDTGAFEEFWVEIKLK